MILGDLLARWAGKQALFASIESLLALGGTGFQPMSLAVPARVTSKQRFDAVDFGPRDTPLTLDAIAS